MMEGYILGGMGGAEEVKVDIYVRPPTLTHLLYQNNNTISTVVIKTTSKTSKTAS